MVSRKFKSSTGEVVRLTLPSGAVALVNNDWEELPPQFHKEAYANGCISDDMIKNTADERVESQVVDTLNKVALKKDKIRSVILSWLANNKIENFYNNRGKGDWKPKATLISTEIGERVFKGESESVWYNLLEEGIDLPEFK